MQKPQNYASNALQGCFFTHTITPSRPKPVTTTCSLSNNQQAAASTTRRSTLISTVTTLLAFASPPLPSLAAMTKEAELLEIRRLAQDAYAKRDFASAVEIITASVNAEPEEPIWREMRAQALVDGKNFTEALRDFDQALKLLKPQGEASLDRARVLSGKGLALEGIGDWVAALDTYTEALNMAQATGGFADPYILNSRGNCHASLGEWKQAREDYLASARGFQTATREDATLQQRLDGAVFSQSNAALMLAQLGDERAAIKEIQGIARKAPGSADMRAALAALYWGEGNETAAEAEWEFACSKINVGCSKYQDIDWLFRIRRWPPVMIDKMREFLALRSNVKILKNNDGSTAATAGFRE